MLIESTIDLETVKQSYVNSIDQLSKELLNMKEQNEQLNTEKQLLNTQLENRSVDVDQEQDKQIEGSFHSFSYHLENKCFKIFRIFTN